MPSACGTRIIDGMTAPSTAVRRLYRRPDRGLVHGLGGVAAGIAEHLHLRPWTIRIAFGVLAAAGGLGVALYGAYWIVLPTRDDLPRSRVPAWVEFGLAAVAGIAAVAAAATSG